MVESSFQMKFSGPDSKKYAFSLQRSINNMPKSILPTVWKHVARWFGEIVMERQFEEQGAFFPGGSRSNLGRWMAIDHKYENWKATHGMFTNIGKATGTMWENFTDYTKQPSTVEVINGGFGVTLGSEARRVFGQSSRSGGSQVSDEYSQYFNEVRWIFGEKLPNIASVGLMKIFAMSYVLAMKVASGERSRSGQEWNFGGKLIQTKTVLREFPSNQIDKYIDGLLLDGAIVGRLK